VLTPFMGLLSDAASVNVAYTIPMASFAVVR
jgi:hypothetical protein